ncbi:response regulator transcription factor [Rubellimicrobium roseum]|uniref:Response regulator transcription factor n=1 Tax=Rubellimicrobium roseum TaxID=687525 RepID=A0A5C4N9G8_9RHOB|nr:response regulator transcription factor [Rubellimicrobium roseum]TNC63580.1 response regulator transcription factor [Rubellimicrobium roseum]
MTTVLIADDHPIVLEGLASLLIGTKFHVAFRCTSGQDVLRALEIGTPDIVVLDVNMPGPNGIELLGDLKVRGLSEKTVLLTSSLSPEQLTEALSFRVGGLVLKESAARQFLRCLEAVEMGEQWLDPELTRRLVNGNFSSQGSVTGMNGSLTKRELDVLRLAAAGSRNKEIGRALGITEGTVKMYLHSIYQKLGVTNRMEMVNVARQRALL